MRLFHTPATRRQFLTSSATALAGLAAGPRFAHALGRPGMQESLHYFPKTAHGRRGTLVELLPPSSAEQFRALALVAMDAARHAGADFADIRIGVQHDVWTYGARIAVGYGLRACVNGTWSFQAGTTMTADAVARAARTVAADARTAATINTRLRQPPGLTWAPAPIVTGEWRSPTEIDPLTVSLDDYIRIQRSCTEVARRHGVGIETNCGIGWEIETRIFASTEGSLVTQELIRGVVRLMTGAALPTPENNVSIDLLDEGKRSVGFEAALNPTLFDKLGIAAEQALRWRELRETSFDDVGRYPVVLDGATMASVLGQTVTVALDGDRVAGFEMDASGRSFLTPVSEIVGAATPQFSPLLTMTSGRAMPSSVAVQWDDDGVVPHTYTVIEKGNVVDYHTTRETAPYLAEVYAKQGRPLRSHGNCLAPTPASVPMSFGGDVHVAPASGTASIDDLMREMGRGFLIMSGTAQASPALSGGLLRAQLVVEVQQGKPVRRLRNMWFVFSTKGVANKGLMTLGDSRTLGSALAVTKKGMPWQTMVHPVTAPAAFCKEMDVVRMSISA